MKFDHPISGKFVKRYKRFMADIQLDGCAEVVTAHCANSGKMKDILIPDSPVILSKSPNPDRKLKYTWEMIQIDGEWIGANTHNPNKIVESALNNREIPEFSHYDHIKREVKYGKNSRIDFLLSKDGEKDLYLEVKNVHLKVGQTAQFPDTVTERGTKHLYELIEMKKQGFECAVFYMIQRSDCVDFSPARDLDENYATAYDEALEHGVQMIPYSCLVSPQEIKIHKRLKLA